MISFTVSRREAQTIRAIAARAAKLAIDAGIKWPDVLTYQMDISACHANGCRLRLDDLLAADDFDFEHDVFGIHEHLNRNNGKLKHAFLPRFSDF